MGLYHVFSSMGQLWPCASLCAMIAANPYTPAGPIMDEPTPLVQGSVLVESQRLA
jgi:hypothetical protein